MITIAHTSIEISAMDLFPKEAERFFRSPITIHMISISAPRTIAVRISYSAKSFMPYIIP